MKRFWIGLAMLIVLLIGGFWAGRRMERIHLPCAMDLQWAADRAMEGDWKGASGLAARAKTAWENNWYFTTAISNHQPIDEIDALFEELEIYLARRETSPYSATCRYLSQRVKDLGDSFRLSWWNLL